MLLAMYVYYNVTIYTRKLSCARTSISDGKAIWIACAKAARPDRCRYIGLDRPLPKPRLETGAKIAVGRVITGANRHWRHDLAGSSAGDGERGASHRHGELATCFRNHGCPGRAFRYSCRTKLPAASSTRHHNPQDCRPANRHILPRPGMAASTCRPGFRSYGPASRIVDRDCLRLKLTTLGGSR